MDSCFTLKLLDRQVKMGRTEVNGRSHFGNSQTPRLAFTHANQCSDPLTALTMRSSVSS